MDRMIVNYVHNPLEPVLERTIREFAVGTSVAEAIAAIGAGNGDRLGGIGDRLKSVPNTGFKSVPITSADYVVNIDGMILSERADLAACRPTGCVVICPVPQGGGEDGKLLRSLAQIVIVIVAVATQQYYGAALAEGLGVSLQAANAIIQVGIMTAGSLLVNALIPYQPDTTGAGAGGYEQSRTYGWDVAGNADAEGIPWPVLHGTHRITPPIIGKYIEVDGDKQWLNILYAVADHAIDGDLKSSGIDEDSIEINGNPVVKGEDVFWDIRFGGVNQSCIQYFQDTRAMKSVGMKITTDWTSIVTDGLSIEGLGIALSLPRGLYYAANDGSLAEQTIAVDIDVRLLPAGDWQRLSAYNQAVFTVTASRWSGGYYQWGHGYGGNPWIELEQGSDAPGAHVEGDPYTPPADYFHVIDAVEPGPPRSAFQWHWVVDAETIRQVGSVLLPTCQITGAQSSPLRRTYYRDRLTPGEYEIRARFADGVAPPSTSRYANDVWFDYIEEIIYDDFAYPGAALFALRLLATDKYSGGLPAVSMIATRSTVPVWTGAAYENKPADNPAWFCYDILHNGAYGAGQPHSRIDYPAFAAWAAYCQTKGYKINLYSDTILSLRKALDNAAALGEGAVIQKGGLYTCLIDEEVAYPVQSFIFNAGNTMRESYHEEYMAMDDRANCIGVTYWDADKGWKRTSLEIPGPDYDETAQEIKKTDMTLIGCTTRAEAIKHGYRALNRNRLLTRTASWDVGLDAMACMPWDPVVPPVGIDGRCVSGTASAVKIDRTVILLPGHVYKIRVQNATDDTVEEKTLAAVAVETTTDTLAITGTWTHVPVSLELYVFYESGYDRGIMRIVRITRKDDQTRRIHAIEYNAAVCDDTGVVDPPEQPQAVNRVAHLRAVEVWRGGAETRAQLTWAGFALLWRCWHRRTGESAWISAGETNHPSIEIRGLDYGPEYDFCVSATKNPADGETVTLTLVGKTDPPGDIAAVTAVPWEDGATFSWAKVADFDLAGYQVRSGIHWQPGTDYNGLAGDFWVVPTDGTPRRYKLVDPGVSGASEPAWPASGTIADGGCVWQEDSALWAWDPIADTNYQRSLTNDEQRVQGTGSAAIRIWAVGRDAFDNVSETPATASCIVLNQKPYLSVGPTTVSGTFTDLPGAIAKLPSGGGKIIIKNGTYTATGAIFLPDKHLEIEGETRDGVIVKNANNTNLFTLYNLLKQVAFRSITIQSNSSSYTNAPKMFNIYGATYAAFTARVAIEGVTFNLARNSSNPWEGDYGIYADKCSGADIIVDNCLFNNGYIAMMAYGDIYSVLRVTDNIVAGTTRGFHANPRSTAYYTGNVLQDMIDVGLWFPGGTGQINVENNKLHFANYDVGMSYAIGLQMTNNTYHSKISGNEIVIFNDAYQYGTARIIGMTLLGQYMQVLDNQIRVGGSPLNNTNDDHYAIHWSGGSNGKISGNTLYHESTNVFGCGLEMTAGTDNRVEGNNLIAVGKGGPAIKLGAPTARNTGRNTVTGDWTTHVADSGAGNTVNRLSGGSW